MVKFENFSELILNFFQFENFCSLVPPNKIQILLLIDSLLKLFGISLLSTLSSFLYFINYYINYQMKGVLGFWGQTMD